MGFIWGYCMVFKRKKQLANQAIRKFVLTSYSTEPVDLIAIREEESEKLIDKVMRDHAYGHKHICMQPGKIKSALHSAFFPGSPPYQHGGVADISAASLINLSEIKKWFDNHKIKKQVAL